MFGSKHFQLLNNWFKNLYKKLQCSNNQVQKHWALRTRNFFPENQIIPLWNNYCYLPTISHQLAVILHKYCWYCCFMYKTYLTSDLLLKICQIKGYYYVPLIIGSALLITLMVPNDPYECLINRQYVIEQIWSTDSITRNWKTIMLKIKFSAKMAKAWNPI